MGDACASLQMKMAAKMNQMSNVKYIYRPCPHVVHAGVHMVVLTGSFIGLWPVAQTLCGEKA